MKTECEVGMVHQFIGILGKTADFVWSVQVYVEPPQPETHLIPAYLASLSLNNLDQSNT